MNWTEGTLARHSRGRKGREITLRQKEHFAKARSGLLSAKAKLSPPSISFFAVAAHASPPAHHCPADFSVDSSRNRFREKPALRSSHYFEDDDLELPSPASLQLGQAEEGAVSQKRQKLLSRGDWVGTNVQKRIQVHFPRPRASIGGPWGGTRSHRHSSRQRLRHILGVKALDAQNVVPEPAIRLSTPVARSQLRVRVGSQERALGGSSISRSRGGVQRDFDFNYHVARTGGTKYSEGPRQNADHGQSSPVWNTSRAQVPTHQSSKDSGGSFMVTKSPRLIHPVPRRPALQQQLRSQSSDSDYATSTRAQAGIRRPDVPFAQCQSNEEWRLFVVEAGHGQALSDLGVYGSHETSSKRPISPGVSQIGQSSRLSHNGEASILSKDLEVDERNTMDQFSPTRMLANPLHSNESDVPSICEDEQDNTSASLKPSASSLDPYLLQSDPSLGSIEGKELREAEGLSENLYKVGLPARPPSSSNSSEHILRRLDTLPIPQDPKINNEQTTPPMQAKQQHPEARAKFVKETPLTSFMLVANNDMWRKFILGEPDDDPEEAFEEARKETARILRPYDTHISTAEGRDNSEEQDSHAELTEASGVSENDSDADVRIAALQHDIASQDSQPFAFGSVASLSSEVDVRDFPHPNDQFSAETSAASINHRATAGDALPHPNLEANPPFSDATASTGQATAGSSSSLGSSTRSLAVPVNEFSRRGDTWSLATHKADDASLIVQPPSLREREFSVDNLKFTRPKAFLGKKARRIDEQQHIELSAPQIRGRAQVRRRQRSTVDGRPIVRKLPNFSSDPIEDPDDIPARRLQKPFMFGPLDTQED